MKEYIVVSALIFKETKIIKKSDLKDGFKIKFGTFSYIINEETLKFISPIGFNFNGNYYTTYYFGPFKSIEEAKFFISLGRNSYFSKLLEHLLEDSERGEYLKNKEYLNKRKDQYPEYFI